MMGMCSPILLRRPTMLLTIRLPSPMDTPGEMFDLHESSSSAHHDVRMRVNVCETREGST
eukprot:1141674-Pelagomonas_calceolata.AAC.8